MRDLETQSTAITEGSDAGGTAPGKATLSQRVYRSAAGAPASNANAAVAATAGLMGAPLPAAVQATFESSLGADLSSVRVHTGAESSAAAEGLGARAFATGQDIHFGAGQYQPEDPFGVHLLAHEVAHTVQQGSGASGPQPKLEVSEPGDAFEVEADQAASAMVRGEATRVSPAAPTAARTVQRFGLGEHAGDIGGASSAPAPAAVSTPPSADNPTGAPAPSVGGAPPAQAGAAGGNAGRPTLRVGSRGADVEELQRQLAAAGHACAADGQFGPGTRAAVVAYQGSKGLGADGVVGPMTWGALGGGGGATTGASSATTPAGGGATPAPGGNSTPGTGSTTTATPTTQTGHTTGGDGAEGATPAEAPPGASSGNATRDAIVAAARSKIGTIFSDVPGAADETGDATRTGWESLTEVFALAFPNFPPKIVKYIKYGKNNGKAGSNGNGLVSWCGIFATWAIMTGGGTCGTWDGGPRCSAMNRITSDPKPGDVGYFTANQHHCIIASVNGDQIETIDGNSYDADGGGNGAVTSKMRSRGEFAGFFKNVAD